LNNSVSIICHFAFSSFSFIFFQKKKNPGWVQHGSCIARKGIPYLPSNSILNESVPLVDRIPIAAFYDSAGFLSGVQLYLNYSTCCDYGTCGCQSAHAAFPVQRYFPNQTFIIQNLRQCPSCGPALFWGSNQRNHSFPGLENVPHHFTYTTWRDPETVCSSTATQFYADRWHIGFGVPDNSEYFLASDGFIWLPMDLYDTPLGFYDTKICVSLMGVHVAPYPTPSALGSFTYYVMYRGVDTLQRTYGVHLDFLGGSQPYSIYENFQKFIFIPEPSSALHIYFGNYEDGL
jgi:hypothetical protein